MTVKAIDRHLQHWCSVRASLLKALCPLLSYVRLGTLLKGQQKILWPSSPQAVHFMLIKLTRRTTLKEASVSDRELGAVRNSNYASGALEEDCDIGDKSHPKTPQQDRAHRHTLGPRRGLLCLQLAISLWEKALCKHHPGGL